MRAGERGSTLLAVLAVIAGLGAALATIGPLWAQSGRRDRELELVRIGVSYAQAIERYRVATPGARKRFPQRLEDLLDDGRHLGVLRHLRELYADPMAPDQPWGLVRDPEGGIQGIYSTAPGQPMRSAPWSWKGMALPAAQAYNDWKFIAKAQP